MQSCFIQAWSREGVLSNASMKVGIPMSGRSRGLIHRGLGSFVKRDELQTEPGAVGIHGYASGEGVLSFQGQEMLEVTKPSMRTEGVWD